MRRIASLAMLREYVGDATTARLVAAYGGTTIKFPKRRKGETWDRLAKHLGDEAARELCEMFSGESLYIPRDAANERDARRIAVAKLLAEGYSYAEIARDMRWEMRYTERGLRKLMGASLRQTTAQLPLAGLEEPAGT